VKGPSSQNAPIGSSVSFRCEAFGSPIPVVHWLKNGERISQHGTEDIGISEEATANVGRTTLNEGGTVGVLKIDSASASDAAKYTCVATSSGGVVRSDASLEIAQAG